MFSVAVDNQPYLTHSWTSAFAEPSQLSAVNLRQGTAGASAWLSLDNLVVTAGEVPPRLTTSSSGTTSIRPTTILVNVKPQS